MLLFCRSCIWKKERGSHVILMVHAWTYANKYIAGPISNLFFSGLKRTQLITQPVRSSLISDSWRVKECSRGPSWLGGRMRVFWHQLRWGWTLFPQTCSIWMTTQQIHCLGSSWSWEILYGSSGSLGLAKTPVSSRSLELIPKAWTGLQSLSGFWLCVEFVVKFAPCQINSILSVSVIPSAIGRVGISKCSIWWSFLLNACSSLFGCFLGGGVGVFWGFLGYSFPWIAILLTAWISRTLKHQPWLNAQRFNICLMSAPSEQLSPTANAEQKLWLLIMSKRSQCPCGVNHRILYFHFQPHQAHKELHSAVFL